MEEIYLRFANREEYEFIRQNMYNSIPETSNYMFSELPRLIEDMASCFNL
ncbi:hypothetical protein [Kosmotoga arenicorallina]|nr:hypothetical protein [Kosmotoga arenicorallina]